jgi:hypothetical protein
MTAMPGQDETPRRSVVEGPRSNSRGCLTLSLEGSSRTEGPATGLARALPWGSAATTVAGLCRDLTGFATERSGGMRFARGAYHAREARDAWGAR